MINKKGNVTFVFAMVIISIISFFIFFFVFSKLGNVVSTEANDVACNSFLSAKSNQAVKAGEFFYEIDKKCQKDDIKIKETSKDKTFEVLSERMLSCWDRYGKGEYDFMSNLNTDGNWCFTCGAATFSNTGEVYDFNEYVEWTKTHNIKLKNGTEIPYYNYVAMKYSDYNEQEFMEMNTALIQLDDLRSDSDYTALVFHLQNQYQYLSDLAMKKIDTNEKVYIVYRYDRWEKGLSDLALQTGGGIAAGLIGGYFTAYVALLPLGPVGAFVGTAKFLTTVVKAAKVGDRIEKVGNAIKLMSKAIKISTAVGAGGAGGTIGYNTNLHNLQYVDLMNQEQYYRVCGTEPQSFN